MIDPASPNAATVQITDFKVREFILNASHVDNKGRAEFFLGVGFTQQKWDVLREALVAHPQNNAVFRLTHTGFGTKYRVDAGSHHQTAAIRVSTQYG